MAKKGTTSRMRVFFAEIEGDDDTMQTGLKAISAAVSKTFQAKAVLVGGNETLVLPNNLEVDEEYEEFDDSIPELPNGSATKKKSNRKPPTMGIVPDLDLKPKGKESLRDFFTEKSPKKQWEMIVVFIYYMQKELEIQNITPNHVYTCFKDVNKKASVDIPQGVRNVASRQGYIDSKNGDDLVMTVPGENFVEHDLPASGNGGE